MKHWYFIITDKPSDSDGLTDDGEKQEDIKTAIRNEPHKHDESQEHLSTSTTNSGV